MEVKWRNKKTFPHREDIDTSMNIIVWLYELNPVQLKTKYHTGPSVTNKNAKCSRSSLVFFGIGFPPQILPTNLFRQIFILQRPLFSMFLFIYNPFFSHWLPKKAPAFWVTLMVGS